MPSIETDLQPIQNGMRRSTGGYCAWGISQGKFYDGDLLVSKIVEGKLYVNYNKDIEKTWEQDIPGFILKTDTNRPTLEK
jgi:hypothetical protein